MNRGRFPQAGLASAVLTLYDKEKLTIQDARGVIRMVQSAAASGADH